jgi:hypothetical protein
MNEDEYRGEQMRQNDMVESIARGHLRREKENAFERLNQSLEKSERLAQDLTETTRVLKNSHACETPYHDSLDRSPPN